MDSRLTTLPRRPAPAARLDARHASARGRATPLAGGCRASYRVVQRPRPAWRNLVDATDLKSVSRQGVPVRVRARAPRSLPGASNAFLEKVEWAGQRTRRHAAVHDHVDRLSPDRCPAPCHARFLVGKFARRSLTERSAVTDQASRSEEGPATSRLRLHSGLDRIRVLMQPVRRAGQRPIGLSAAPT